jgi:hypothetical protein
MMPRDKNTIKGSRLWLSLCAWAIVFVYLFCIPFAATKGGDFIHLWLGAHAIATGNGEYLYNPEFHRDILIQYRFSLDFYWGPRYDILGAFFYPPITGLIYSPLGLLEPAVAQGIQALINIGIGILSAWLLTELIDRRLSFPAVVLLLFSFPSFFYSFVLGQNGIQTMGVVLLGLYALKRNKPLLAGTWWGLLLYKPNWLLAVGWIPVVAKNSRMILGLASGIICLSLISIAFLGLSSFASYFSVFTDLLGLHNLPQYPLESQYSLLSLVRRVVGINLSADLIGWSVVAMIIGVTLWLIWRTQRGSKQVDLQQGGGIVIALGLVTAVCINPHLHHYDLLLVGAMSIVALSERAVLKGREQRTLFAIVGLQYGAFLLEGLLEASYAFPTLATLTLLCWLMRRVFIIETDLNLRVKEQE